MTKRSRDNEAFPEGSVTPLHHRRRHGSGVFWALELVEDRATRQPLLVLKIRDPVPARSRSARLGGLAS